MDLRRRLPAAVLAVIALALTAVIVSRVSAGADPAPRDTTPIVISPDASPSPTSTTPSDDKSGKVTPRVRDDDDDDGPDDDDDDHTGRGDDDD
jgi:hypothetical protein